MEAVAALWIPSCGCGLPPNVDDDDGGCYGRGGGTGDSTDEDCHANTIHTTTTNTAWICWCCGCCCCCYCFDWQLGFVVVVAETAAAVVAGSVASTVASSVAIVIAATVVASTRQPRLVTQNPH